MSSSIVPMASGNSWVRSCSEVGAIISPASDCALSFSVDNSPLTVCDCFSMDWKYFPPALVERSMLAVISSTVTLPLLMRSYRLAMLSPVVWLISARGLNPASIICRISSSMTLPALLICP